MERRNSKVAELINTDDPSVVVGTSDLNIDQRTRSANIKDMVSGNDDIDRSHEELVGNDNSIPPSRQSQYSIQREDGQDVNINQSSSFSEDDYVVIDCVNDKPNQFPVGLDSPAQRNTLDVDALRSKLSQLESVDNPMVSPTGSLPGSIHAKEPFYKTADIELEGGGVHQVTIQVDTAGVVIIWEFNTEPKVCIRQLLIIIHNL